jgi:hypothetical protein
MGAGLGCCRGNASSWKLAGVFETLQEARTAAAHAGPGHDVRWGSYDQRDKEFVSGNSRR